MDSETLSAAEVSGPLTPGELKFERYRQLAGFILAPALFIVMWLAPLGGLEPRAHRLAAIMSAVVVLWITEAIPLPVTALAGAAACILAGVAPAADVLKPFADPVMFLFILAQAIFLHGLDRRFAFGVLSLRWVDGRPARIMFAFGMVTAAISAWISNTATTAMMYSIGLSLLSFLLRGPDGKPQIDRRYATGLMLMTSFAASIGGLATPIGTPPNLIGLGWVRKLLGIEMPFFKFMMIGTPIVLVLFLFLFAYLNYFCNAGVRRLPSTGESLRQERANLGNWTTAQKSTLVAFLLTVIMWVTPGVLALVWGEHSKIYELTSSRLPEAAAAIIGATLLFLLPGQKGAAVLNWRQAAEIDWGVVLLYGGGLALGTLAKDTGLANAIGTGLAAWLPSGNGLALLIASTLVAALVSEATSNTAAANIVVPVTIAVAQAAHADALECALGATMGASLGFMLPVSTPCNAIVYGSGYVPLTRMVRYGAILDVAGVIVIVTLIRLLLPLVR